jgi:hypothetical protein
MAKPYFPRTPFQIGDVDLMNSRLLGKVDLPPASLLAKLPNAVANLDANIGVHSSSIDLVEALYLVDALSRSSRARGHADAWPEDGLDPLAGDHPVKTAKQDSMPKISRFPIGGGRQLRPTLC